MITRQEAATHRVMKPTKEESPPPYHLDILGAVWQYGLATYFENETESRQIGIHVRAHTVAAPQQTTVLSVVWPAFKRSIAPKSAIHAFCLISGISDDEGGRQGSSLERCPGSRARRSFKRTPTLSDPGRWSEEQKQKRLPVGSR